MGLSSPLFIYQTAIIGHDIKEDIQCALNRQKSISDSEFVSLFVAVDSWSDFFSRESWSRIGGKEMLREWEDPLIGSLLFFLNHWKQGEPFFIFVSHFLSFAEFHVVFLLMKGLPFLLRISLQVMEH